MSKKSGVWEYFEKQKNESECTCLICKKKYKAEKGNTSNLRNHLHRMHAVKFKELILKEEDKKRVEGTNQTTIEEALQAQAEGRKERQLNKNDKRSREITEALTKMIALDMTPFRIVERKGFRMFVNRLEPKYKLPTRQEVSKTLIPELYKQNVAENASLIESLHLQSCAFTTDGWTSTSNDSYISLTAHYIDPNQFTPRNSCLAVRYMAERHTAENLKQFLNLLLTEWKFDVTKQSLVFITDNAANMLKAVEGLGVEHRGCFAHTIQLVIKDSLEAFQGITRILAKSRDIATHFRKSSNAKVKLTEEQAVQNLPRNQLKQETKTRWNSTFYMMQRLVEQKKSISVVLLSVSTVPNLTSYEWSTAEALVKTLQPFEEVTRQMSGEKYPTMSMVIPTLNGLCQDLETMTDGLNDFQNALKEGIKKRWGDYEKDELYAISTLLDPTFKDIVFLSEEARLLAVDRLKTIVTITNNISVISLSDSQSFNQRVTDGGGDVINEGASTSSAENVDPIPNHPNNEKKGGIWSFVEKQKRHKSESRGSQVDFVGNEIIAYLQEPVINRKHVDVYNWWKEKRNRFPNLANTASKYLGIPATSVPSERLFSTAGDVITEERNRLKPGKAEMLVFLHSNLNLK